MLENIISEMINGNYSFFIMLVGIINLIYAIKKGRK